MTNKNLLRRAKRNSEKPFVPLQLLNEMEPRTVRARD